MPTYGYARVSTQGQALEIQLAQLQAGGCTRIFREKASAADIERRELKRLLRVVTAQDVVVVTRLDRLARSTRDLLNIIATIAERGAGFRSLADVWADTTTPHGRLMLTVLGGLAEFERDLIRMRTSEGRMNARARGVKFGRRPKLSEAQRLQAIARRRAGETLGVIAETFQVSPSTISRLCP